jgi:hypothetical protein
MPHSQPFPYDTRSPLVPDILVHGPQSGDLVEPPDPWAFTESCILRSAGSGLAGGAMGFFFGAVFSGYGSLQPHDPALRDWQATAAAQQQAAAARAAGGAGAAGGAAGATPHLPLAMPGPPAAPMLPGALPYSYLDPPKVPLLRALKEGLVEVRAAAGRRARALATHSNDSPHPTPFTPSPHPTALSSQMKTRSISQGKTFMIVGATFAAIECTLEKLRGKKDLKNAIVAGFSTGALLAARAGPAAMMLGGGGFAAFSIAIELASPWLFGH